MLAAVTVASPIPKHVSQNPRPTEARVAAYMVVIKLTEEATPHDISHVKHVVRAMEGIEEVTEDQDSTPTLLAHIETRIEPGHRKVLERRCGALVNVSRAHIAIDRDRTRR
jgi:hypothetical protein